MRKLTTGYIGLIILIALCITFPPLIVAAVPLVIWRARAFRTSYVGHIREAETDMRAQYSEAVTQGRIRHAKAWR